MTHSIAPDLHAAHLIREERNIEVFSQVQGPSVMMTEGELWQRQHRMLMPAFSPRRVAGYAALMVAAARRALDAAVPQQAVGSALVNANTLTTQVTMDVILQALFSSTPGEDLRHVSAAVQTLNEIAMREVFLPMSPPDWLPLPGKATKRQAMRTLNELIDGHIQARRQMPAGTEPTTDLLAMLLAARDTAPDGSGQGAGLSEVALRAQCKVMFLAGHDTSATALQLWIWLMTAHPQAAQRAREEVQRVRVRLTRLA